MKNWLRQHGFALTEAFRHLVKTPGSFGLNVLVIAIAFALPFTGLTVLENIRPVSEQLTVDPEISIYFTMETPREQAKELAQPIRTVLGGDKAKAKLEFVPREKALEALKQRTGLSDALATLGMNPLPDSYVVKLGRFQTAAEAARIDAIAAQLKALPGVEHVQVDSAWIKRLSALMHVLKLALLFLAATLGVVVIAVVFNTIRLQVMTQREEIGISRLFGATDAFIYRPFYYTGALLGLLAAGIALGAVALLLEPLNEGVIDFARLYASDFRLLPLNAPMTLALLAGSMALGLAGAVLSVRRHLAGAA